MGLFGSMKDMGIFLSHGKNTEIILGIIFFISSNQQEHKRNLSLSWCGFFGYARNVHSDFLGRQILKLGFFWV